MALLGSSWSLLGRSGPKMGPNMVPKVIKKLVKNLSKKYKKWEPSWVSFWVSNFLYIEIAGLRHFLPDFKFCLSFIFSFSLGFGALWVPLGSLLGLLAVLLGGLWTQKC